MSVNHHLLLSGQARDCLRNGLERSGRITRGRLRNVCWGSRCGWRRLRQVDVRGRWWEFTLNIQQTGLQVDYIFTERIVFRLHGFEGLLHVEVLAYLLLQFLDVSLFALAKSSLQ